MTTTYTIPGLDIEIQGTHAEGRAVLLKQEFGGNVHQVELQELHVRWLAQQLGILETCNLQRALGRSLEMASKLCRLLQITNDLGHEDLDIELAHAVELVDFLEFICDGFRDQHAPALQEVNTAALKTTSETGELFAEGVKQ
ncbi:hypothetical protein [Variovorax boronicumulans]|uniref:hypothetical protein n=1 Tax=Variovorax boronicumulans TaxID=436515 RepID=UPI00078247BE|nr:hypothetical protein [Variovorax boronicumulans]